MTATDAQTTSITWIGHSTVLLELDGMRLLTDPLLRGRLGHLRRVAAPPDADVLVNLDAVLVSHVHHDHLDVPSLRRLGRSLHIVAPVGAGRVLRRRGFGRVTEVDVGDELELGTITIRATHAEHAHRRPPLGRQTQALGYVVAASSRVYFAGDTDLFEGMAGLVPELDVALLPVAGWGPRIPRGHLDPLRAAQALVLLHPRVAVPIHWGTYRRVGLPRQPELLRAPAERFVHLARELAPEVDVRLVPVGGRVPPAAFGGGAAAVPLQPAGVLS
jgi:L-ascorbate metabolism protein UlaG (beta-lactamase superfamily)